MSSPFPPQQPITTVQKTILPQTTSVSQEVASSSFTQQMLASIQIILHNSQTPPFYYAVKSGDTLQSIAELFYGNANYYTIILVANNMTNPNAIFVGLQLIIPPVQAGG